MKTYNKSSFAYKLRAWIIVFLGILQVLHSVVLLVCSEDSGLIREVWFWMIFTIAFTGWEIKNNFSIGRLDGVVVQVIDFVISILYLLAVFEKNKMIIVAIVEGIIIVLGIIVIYQKTYKTSIVAKRKRKNK